MEPLQGIKKLQISNYHKRKLIIGLPCQPCFIHIYHILQYNMIKEGGYMFDVAGKSCRRRLYTKDKHKHGVIAVTAAETRVTVELDSSEFSLL